MGYKIVQFFPGIFWDPPAAPPVVTPAPFSGVIHTRSVGMAISSIASYLPTMQEFIDHWTAVNASISPTVLTLLGGYAVADFTADRDAIDAAITAIEPADNARQFAAAQRDLQKGVVRPRIFQFRATVLGQLAGTAYAKTLPTMPNFSANQGAHLKVLDDVANGWANINAATIPGFTGPLLLAGGYAVADFTADVAEMRARFIASTVADDNDRLARSQRNVLLKPAKARMVQYRQAVKGILPPGDPLLNTIPAVSPPPGSTPDPVVLSGVYNSGTNQGDLSWTASANMHILHYDVRYSPGPVYKTADETSIGIVPKTQLTFSTNVGLGVSGATGLYRVYVVLDTLNERGSNTVGVTRV